MTDYQVKDSGQRATLGGGMVRDTEENKIDYTLVLDGPMYDRWAEHMTKGARKYSARNWMKIQNGTREEIAECMERAKRSALRHTRQWLRGDVDEDHAAAVMFNLNAVEFCKGLLAQGTIAQKPAAPPRYRYFVTSTRCPYRVDDFARVVEYVDDDGGLYISGDFQWTAGAPRSADPYRNLPLYPSSEAAFNLAIHGRNLKESR